MEETNVVILAAGQGKRMRAVCSKVLCTVAEKPMLLWVTDAARKAGVEHVCVVASEPDVIDAVKDAGFEVRIQTERLGTGHEEADCQEVSVSKGQRQCIIKEGVGLVDEGIT